MRTIERTTAFKRDYRRAKANPRQRNIDPVLSAIVERLASDEPLPPSSRDHALTGNWAGFRKCHLRPDLLLIYAKPEAEVLRLVRLGSHSDLFR